MEILIRPLKDLPLSRIKSFMREGEPFIRVRDAGDYWLFAELFSSSSFVAFVGDDPVGIVIAMQSQDDPSSLYIQDVAVHRNHRQCGIARRLLGAVENEARRRGCRRVWLTTKPGNMATRVWPRLGFTDVAGDDEADGLQIHRDLKGPGKDRVVFEKRLLRSGGGIG